MFKPSDVNSRYAFLMAAIMGFTATILTGIMKEIFIILALIELFCGFVLVYCEKRMNKAKR